MTCDLAQIHTNGQILDASQPLESVNSSCIAEEKTVLVHDSISSESSISASNISNADFMGSFNFQITQDQYTTLICKMDDLKKHMIRLEVKFDQQKGSQTSAIINERTGGNVGTVDMAKLYTFGVPVKSLDELNKLEEKLKIETFRNELVSLKFCFLAVNVL